MSLLDRLNHSNPNSETTAPIDVAIIGSGPSALYVVARMLDRPMQLSQCMKRLTVFESYQHFGTGMPYAESQNADHHLCNISSEELPALPESFAQWLTKQPEVWLDRFGIQRDRIDPSHTYPRVALGAYFASQWNLLAEKLQSLGIEFSKMPDTRITDILDCDPAEPLKLITQTGQQQAFDHVIIATGHSFPKDDQPTNGYFASPWPIQKILPKDDHYFDCEVGLLGASLSAYDVALSLALHHGKFVEADETVEYVVDEAAHNFQVAMHSAEGWLPHLQYEQVNPIRQLYRHVSRESLHQLISEDRFLRLDTYFDRIMRPALVQALRDDRKNDLAIRLEDTTYSLENFVEDMSAEHQSSNAFSQMLTELPVAYQSVQFDRPIHWKETLDDLMYTLNFYAHYLPGEDHQKLHQLVLPFLMNVIAALPLKSAYRMLALHRCGRLKLISGHVKVTEIQSDGIKVNVTDGENQRSLTYNSFIDCTGQKPVDFDDYPFSSLTKHGKAVPAKAERIHSDDSQNSQEQRNDPDLQYKSLSGVSIDQDYHLRDQTGQRNHRIQDISFPHIAGLRPYSYGLQVCNETAKAVVWGSTTDIAELSQC